MSSGSTLCADHHMIINHLDILPKLIFSHDYNSNNNQLIDDDDSSDDPYATDHFRIYDFKVRRCTRSRSHDWTDCPFAHPGEKARRRDPRRFRYCSTVCSDYRSGVGCPRGDDCQFAHGVFECWLHPTRYRTEPCKDGKNCKRKVCFFAHSSRELRILSHDLSPKLGTAIDSCSSPVIGGGNKITAAAGGRTARNCCLFCRSVSSPASTSNSPTSTLLGLSHFSRSPSLSPPMSPVAHQRRAAAGFSPSNLGAEAASYKEILSELVRSLEGVGISQRQEVCSPAGRSRNTTDGGFLNLPLIQKLNDQAHAIIPPPEYFAQTMTASRSGDDSFEILGGAAPPPYNNRDAEGYWMNESGLGGGSFDPDLGWVNDLLM